MGLLGQSHHSRVQIYWNRHYGIPVHYQGTG